MEKRKQVEELILALSGRCSAMPTLETLLELRDIHALYKLPVWVHNAGGCNVLSSIIKRLTLNLLCAFYR